MRNPWIARFIIIFAVMLWGAYTITPTLMQEDSETLLAKQASEASGSAPKISVDEDRLPQAKHLPSPRCSVAALRAAASCPYQPCTSSPLLCHTRQARQRSTPSLRAPRMPQACVTSLLLRARDRRQQIRRKVCVSEAI